MMTYCHFDDQGHIVTDTDFLNQHFATGVGHYDAGWSKIEAEWFYEKLTLLANTLPLMVVLSLEE